MKAMVLAAGIGSRLGALGEHTPKCLLEAGGKTMLEHVINRLKRIGVDEIVINLHHLGEAIEEFIKAQNYFGIKIIFSHEAERLETGGGLKKAQSHFIGEQAFIVHNADVYSDIALEDLLISFQTHQPIAVLAVCKTAEARVLLFNDGQKLIGWRNRETGAEKKLSTVEQPIELGFCGISVLSPDIFDYMDQKKDHFSIIDTFLNAAHQGKAIMPHVIGSAYWIDTGTLAKLEMLRKRLAC